VLVIFEFLLYAMVLFYLTKVADIAAKFANLKTFMSDAWNFLDVLNLVRKGRNSVSTEYIDMF